VWKGVLWSDTQKYEDQVQRQNEVLSPGPVREVSCGKHILDRGHSVKINNIYRLAKVKGYIYRVVKEAIEIQLHPNNFNRDGGFILSKTWHPLLFQLRSNTGNHNRDQAQQPSVSIH
jgi:hypothetical protein